MTVISDFIEVSTRGRRDVADITGELRSIIERHGVRDGIVVVFVPGSTAALSTIEYEPGLKQDMDRVLERLVPYGDRYAHHETWHDDNGAAHVQAALIGPSLTIPVIKGELTLGTWQQAVLIDCDTRPRKRKLAVQILY
ncbi:MAG TPA: YjbQ family protein [Spirochaetes bacterium]|nr:YjbQ family protein [Spirochaetota bacterium]